MLILLIYRCEKKKKKKRPVLETSEMISILFEKNPSIKEDGNVSTW